MLTRKVLFLELQRAQHEALSEIKSMLHEQQAVHEKLILHLLRRDSEKDDRLMGLVGALQAYQLDKVPIPPPPADPEAMKAKAEAEKEASIAELVETMEKHDREAELALAEKLRSGGKLQADI